jgi:hypothetical protein
MKQVRLFCASVAFVLVLSVSAFAGDVNSPAVPNPATGCQTQGVTGSISEDGLTDPTSISDTTIVDAVTDLTVRLCLKWFL